MVSGCLANTTRDYGTRISHVSKIISIRPAQEMFSITWMLGSRCNYDCMYCDPEWHDDTSRPHDLDTMQQVWKNIYAKTQSLRLPYKISFTGGEVTANKNFLPLIKWMRAEYPSIGMILITTNGSASKEYYKRLTNHVEAISFSTHSEHMNEKEFFSKVETIENIMIRPKKSLHVNIMDEFWNQDRILLYENFLQERGISYSINRINYNHQTRSYPIMKGVANLD